MSHHRAVKNLHQRRAQFRAAVRRPSVRPSKAPASRLDLRPVNPRASCYSIVHRRAKERQALITSQACNRAFRRALDALGERPSQSSPTAVDRAFVYQTALNFNNRTYYIVRICNDVTTATSF